MAGAAAPFALVSELRGTSARAPRVAGRAGRRGGEPALLISDLAGPSASTTCCACQADPPMSVGSWVLGGSSTAIAFANARSLFGWFARARGGRHRRARPALATYTAVLLADTAIPVWHEARRELPFVFVSGGAMSAGSAVAILGGGAPARRLALVGAVGELAATAAMERRLGWLGQPYREGAAGRAARAARALTAAGALVMAVGGSRRAGIVAGGALMLGGALATRWSVYKAGFRARPIRSTSSAAAGAGGGARRWPGLSRPFAPWVPRGAYCRIEGRSERRSGRLLPPAQRSRLSTCLPSRSTTDSRVLDRAYAPRAEPCSAFRNTLRRAGRTSVFPVWRGGPTFDSGPKACYGRRRFVHRGTRD
jgi:hypothetical protein